MTTFVFEGGAADNIDVKITSSSATTIVDATTDGPRFVSWFAVGENNGGVPNLTVDIYDGTTAHYQAAESVLWNAKAMTAKQGVLFDQGYVVPLGSLLRVTSSDASGHMDVSGLVILKTPTAAR